MSAGDKNKLDGLDGKSKVCGIIDSNGAFRGTTRGVYGVTPDGAGKYRITHNKNLTGYGVIVTLIDSSAKLYYHVINIKPNYFDVNISTDYGASTNAKFAFFVFEY